MRLLRLRELATKVPLSTHFWLRSGFRANSDSRRPPITVHPELLDADGRITEEELLTVRFSGDNEPSDPGGSDDHAS